MGCLFSRSELYEEKDCVGAYTYNPFWVRPCLNKALCCGLPVWREGGGFQLFLNDGIPLSDPAWAKGSGLRNDFEEDLLGETMRRALMEAPKDCAGGTPAPDLAPVLNKSFCAEINEKLLAPRGFRCEARFWYTYPSGGGGRKPEPNEHFALAIFKTDSTEAGAASALEPANHGSASVRPERHE